MSPAATGCPRPTGRCGLSIGFTNRWASSSWPALPPVRWCGWRRGAGACVRPSWVPSTRLCTWPCLPAPWSSWPALSEPPSTAATGFRNRCTMCWSSLRWQQSLPTRIPQRRSSALPPRATRLRRCNQRPASEPRCCSPRASGHALTNCKGSSTWARDESREGSGQVGQEFLDQLLRRLRQPGFGDQLFEVADRDLGQIDQHRRIAVEMWGGEIHPRLVADQRELHAFVGDPDTEDVAFGWLRPAAGQRFTVRRAHGPLPCHQLLAHPPVVW